MGWVNQEGFVVLVCALVLVSSFNYSNRQSRELSSDENSLSKITHTPATTCALPNRGSSSLNLEGLVVAEGPPPQKCETSLNDIPIKSSQSGRGRRRSQATFVSATEPGALEERRVLERSIPVIDSSRSYTPLAPLSSE